MTDLTQKSIPVNRALWFGIAMSFLFVGLIWLTGALWLRPPPFAGIQDGAIMPRMWYLWQVAEPTFWTRASAWTGLCPAPGHHLVPDLARGAR